MRHFMTTMKLTPIFISILYLTSCNFSDKKTIAETKNVITLDTFADIVEDKVKFEIDTTTLDGKRTYIINKFQYVDPRRYPDFDTLIDLTYDGNKDYIIGYYGSTGTGIKNRIEVFLYNKQIDNYILDSTLSRMPNPTFYIKQKKITGFYIGGGGGGGSKLEWKKDKWITTKTFAVDNDNGKGLWIIDYPQKSKRDTIHREFQMIPPSDILESNVTE